MKQIEYPKAIKVKIKRYINIGDLVVVTDEGELERRRSNRVKRTKLKSTKKTIIGRYMGEGFIQLL